MILITKKDVIHQYSEQFMALRAIKIALLCLVFFLSSCANGDGIVAKKANEFLEITLTHNGKRKVLYKKWEGIEVKIELKNISNLDVGVQVEHIEGIGRLVNLYHYQTKKTPIVFTATKIIPTVLTGLTKLHPGDTLIFEDEVYSRDFEAYYQNHVELHLEAVIVTPFQVNGEIAMAVLADEIPVIDVDQAEPLE